MGTNQAVTVEVPQEVKATTVFKKVIFSCAPFGTSQSGTYVFEKTLRECYANIFAAFDATGEKSIAIPMMSTGVGNVSAKRSAKVAVSEAVKYLIAHPDKKVRFVYGGKDTNDHIFKAHLDALTEMGLIHQLAVNKTGRLNAKTWEMTQATYNLYSPLKNTNLIELATGAIQDDGSDVVVAVVAGKNDPGFLGFFRHKVIDYASSDPTMQDLCKKVADISSSQLNAAEAEAKKKEAS